MGNRGPGGAFPIQQTTQTFFSTNRHFVENPPGSFSLLSFGFPKRFLPDGSVQRFTIDGSRRFCYKLYRFFETLNEWTMELIPSHDVQRFPVALLDSSPGKFMFNAPFRRGQSRPLPQRTMRRLLPPLKRLPHIEKGRLVDLYA